CPRRLSELPEPPPADWGRWEWCCRVRRPPLDRAKSPCGFPDSGVRARGRRRARAAGRSSPRPVSPPDPSWLSAKFAGRSCRSNPFAGAPLGNRAVREAEIEAPAGLVDRRQLDADRIAEAVRFPARAALETMLLLFVHEEIVP